MIEKLKKLTNEELVSQLQKLAGEERRLTAEILWHFKLSEERRIYAEIGYASMYEFAVKHLHYSDGAAHRRISAARLLRELPTLEKSIQDGKLNLTTLTLAKKFFKNTSFKSQEKIELLQQLEGKSRKEIEKKLVSLCPTFIPAEKTRIVGTGETELRVILNDSLIGKLQRIKNLVAHQLPNPSWAELIEFLADKTIEKVDPTSPGEGAPRQKPHNPNSRHIPRSLKIQIWKRDGGKCTYTHEGRRCNSSYALEFDHISPYAKGGKTTSENLRLVCRSHNQFLAAKIFGERKNH